MNSIDVILISYLCKHDFWLILVQEQLMIVCTCLRNLWLRKKVRPRWRRKPNRCRLALSMHLLCRSCTAVCWARHPILNVRHLSCCTKLCMDEVRLLPCLWVLWSIGGHSIEMLDMVIWSMLTPWTKGMEILSCHWYVHECETRLSWPLTRGFCFSIRL